MKTYKGRRSRVIGCSVMVHEPGTYGALLVHALDPRNDLLDLSDGFEWGYGGSGPMQLALALIADAVGPNMAFAHAFAFKEQVIAHLAKEQWEMSQETIQSFVTKQEREVPS